MFVNGPVRAGADCRLKPVLGRVAQATRLFRPATRRTEREQASGVVQPKETKNESCLSSQFPTNRKYCWAPVVPFVYELVAPGRLVNVPLTADALCKLKPAVVQASTRLYLYGRRGQITSYGCEVIQTSTCRKRCFSVCLNSLKNARCSGRSV